MSDRTKHLLILFYIAAALAALSALADYSKMWEADPLAIAPRFETESLVLAPGEPFAFDRAVCVTKDLVVTVHREFYHIATGDRYMFESVSYGAKESDGCSNVEFTGNVPANVPPGSYEYRPLLIYRVNERLQVAKPAPIVQIEVTL